jgi:hypothetical protein
MPECNRIDEALRWTDATVRCVEGKLEEFDGACDQIKVLLDLAAVSVFGADVRRGELKLIVRCRFADRQAVQVKREPNVAQFDRLADSGICSLGFAIRTGLSRANVKVMLCFRLQRAGDLKDEFRVSVRRRKTRDPRQSF